MISFYLCLQVLLVTCLLSGTFARERKCLVPWKNHWPVLLEVWRVANSNMQLTASWPFWTHDRRVSHSCTLVRMCVNKLCIGAEIRKTNRKEVSRAKSSTRSTWVTKQKKKRQVSHSYVRCSRMDAPMSLQKRHKAVQSAENHVSK